MEILGTLEFHDLDVSYTVVPGNGFCQKGMIILKRNSAQDFQKG